MNCYGTACTETLPRIDSFLNQPVKLYGREIHFAVNRNFVIRILMTITVCDDHIKANSIQHSEPQQNVEHKFVWLSAMIVLFFRFVWFEKERYPSPLAIIN